jgi:hypothetical protein
VCGLRHPEPPVNTAEKLEDAEQTGVLALFRLIQAWAGQPPAQGTILRVVTNGIHALGAHDRLQPWAAAVPGLARVAAKEWSRLSAVCVDLPTQVTGPADWDRFARWLLAEPTSAAAPEVVYRDVHRYVRTLRLVELAEPDSLPLRPRGVYVIVDGVRPLTSAPRLRKSTHSVGRRSTFRATSPTWRKCGRSWRRSSSAGATLTELFTRRWSLSIAACCA